AGVSPDKRSDGDSFRPEVFSSLREKISTAGENIKASVDKYIAHAATPQSRAAVGVDAVTLGEMQDALRAICEVANFLSVHVLGGAHLGSVPVPWFDQFEYLERPLVTGNKVAHLRSIWNKFERETNTWGLWDPEGFPGVRRRA